MTNAEIISEIKEAVEYIRSGKTGWLAVKPHWFKDQEQMLDFMMASGKKGIPHLEARIAELAAEPLQADQA